MKSFFLFFIFLSSVLFNRCLANNPDKNSQAKFSSLRGNGMQFIENKGQVIDMNKKLRPDILFAGDGGGSQVYLRKGIVSYVFSNLGEILAEIDEQIEESKERALINKMQEQQMKDDLLRKVFLKIHRVDMEFIAGNVNAGVIKDEQVEGFLNYYYPHCKDGITNVKAYNKVTYEEMYKGIDVVFYGEKEKGIKYDIIVKPKADPKQIKIGYTGAEHIELNKNKLMVTTSAGLLNEYMPKVYQVINNKEIVIDARYEIREMKVNEEVNKIQTSNLSYNNSSHNYELTFQFSNYNPNYSLIIDPWVTYYGGSGYEYWTGSVTNDLLGNVIFSGATASIDFPVSPGAFQSVYQSISTAFPSYSNAFIVKMNPSGQRIFATYLGGNNADYGFGVNTDSNNNIFLTGSTTSTNFPTLNPGGAYFQNTLKGGCDPYISKFNPNGSLIWSTYFGGSSDFFNSNLGNGYGSDVVVDKADNVIVTGSTASTDFPLLAAFQSVLKGSQDAFLAKFTNAGILSWSTYFGGSFDGAGSVWDDNGSGVSADNNNNIFIVGTTPSTDFFITAGAFQTVPIGADIYVTKFGPNGIPVWSTYYGGWGDELGIAIANDGANNVVITGETNATNFPVTPGAFQTKYGGGQRNIVVVKLDNNGGRKWATFLSGSGQQLTSGEDANGIAVDANDNIVVSGDTYSKDFPVTNCAYQTYFAGSEDQYVTTFNPNGALICSGYIGTGTASSSNNEAGYGKGSNVSVFGNYCYVLASSACNYPVTSGAFQTKCGGASDMCLSQFCIYSCGPIPLVNISSSFNKDTLCIGPIDFFASGGTLCSGGGGTSYSWIFSGGSPSSSSIQNPSGIIYNVPGTYNIKLVISTSCGSDSVTKQIVVLDSVAVVTSGNITICQGNKSILSALATGGNGSYQYTWQPGNMNGSVIIVFPQTTTNYSVTVSSTVCNNVSDILTVYVYPAPTAAFIYDPGSPTIIDMVSFYDQSKNNIVSWNWLFGDNNNSTSVLQNPTVSYSDTGTYNVQLIVTDINGCIDTIIEPIHISAYYLFHAPNSFTPNGDNVNDLFKVHSLIISEFEMIVYDRWGNKIFETNDINKGWDGKYKGRDVQEDVYVYMINTTDYKKENHQYIGRVTLIR